MSNSAKFMSKLLKNEQKCPKIGTIWQYLTFKRVFVSYMKRIGWPVSIRFGYWIKKEYRIFAKNISQSNNLHKLTWLPVELTIYFSTNHFILPQSLWLTVVFNCSQQTSIFICRILFFVASFQRKTNSFKNSYLDAVLIVWKVHYKS